MQMNKQTLEILILSALLTLSTPTMLITSPAINPFDDSHIPYTYTNIGDVPYGKTLTFDLVDSGDLDLCKSRQPNDTKQYFTTPTYLLVDKTLGTCSFTTEAINAQQLGAQGVLFVSDLALAYYDKVAPVDDGNGKKVHITVLLTSTFAYRKLYSIKNIHIKVQFETQKTSKVDLTYFLSASGRANYIFLREFKPYYQKLKDYISFRSTYLTIKCPNCKMTQCYISNNYCTFQMDQYHDDVGKYIIDQQLRQWRISCSYLTEIYLQYMDLFDKYCSGNWMASKECGNQLMKRMGIQQYNFGMSSTEVMDEWRMEQNTAGFMSTPELTVNGQLYAGTYQAQQIFKAICQSLTNPPEACTGITPSQSSNNKLLWIIAAIILACILTSLIAYFIYKKCVKQQLTKDIYSKVNELVAKYATQVQEHNQKRKNKQIMRLNEEL